MSEPKVFYWTDEDMVLLRVRPTDGSGWVRYSDFARLAAENKRLREGLEYALRYGTFDSAIDNPLHAASLDAAKAALKEKP